MSERAKVDRQASVYKAGTKKTVSQHTIRGDAPPNLVEMMSLDGPDMGEIPDLESSDQPSDSSASSEQSRKMTFLSLETRVPKIFSSDDRAVKIRIFRNFIEFIYN